MHRSTIYRRTILSLVIFLASAALITGACAQEFNQTPENFKVAFMGDQGLRDDSRAVLHLIRNEGAQAVVHLGDFDYQDNPDAWEAQINDVLGADFPYFSAPGNHDVDRFRGEGGYQWYMEARLNRLGIPWDGDLGVKSSLTYQGILMVLTAPGLFGSGHAEYIAQALDDERAIWRFSGWHMNQRALQTGHKVDQVGWGVYEESRKAGAIIGTAHEHAYTRTYLLSSCQEQTVVNRSDVLVLSPGRSFVFVSGLGGDSIYDQERGGDWWAVIYTSTQNARYGALFGTFNVDGVRNLAQFYFKNIDGEIIDQFTVISNVLQLAPTEAEETAAQPPDGFHLSQSYPNPFTAGQGLGAHISLILPVPAHATLTVYNLAGQVVRRLVDGELPAGAHAAAWDGRDNLGNKAASGVYLVRMQVGDFVQARKMTLMR